MPILPNVMPALEIGQSSSKAPTRRTWLELVSSTPKLETESPVFRVDWEPFDDSYKEHFRWSKNCVYANMVSDGKDY